MTNGEVHELLRAAQQFWHKYRDNIPTDPDDIGDMIQDAGKILEGRPPHAFQLMQFFTEELAIRAAERRTT